MGHFGVQRPILYLRPDIERCDNCSGNESEVLCDLINRIAPTATNIHPQARNIKSGFVSEGRSV